MTDAVSDKISRISNAEKADIDINIIAYTLRKLYLLSFRLEESIMLNFSKEYACEIDCVICVFPENGRYRGAQGLEAALGLAEFCAIRQCIKRFP